MLRTPRCSRRLNDFELNATQDGPAWGGGTSSRTLSQKLTEQKNNKIKWFYPRETNNSSGLLQCKVERLFHKASSPRGPSGSNRAPRVPPAPGHRARACASAALARSSLLVFTGTLARFRCSRLVFLANSSRVKLFNNIFGGTQAAGEPEPKRFSFPASVDSPLQASLRESYDPKS